MGTTRKMGQRYFCPAEYTIKTKPKTNQKTKPNPQVQSQFQSQFQSQWYTLLGKNIIGSFFWLYPLLFSALLRQISPTQPRPQLKFLFSKGQNSFSESVYCTHTTTTMHPKILVKNKQLCYSVVGVFYLWKMHHLGPLHVVLYGFYKWFR